MNADFCKFLAMSKENIGTHAATCDRVVQFFSSKMDCSNQKGKLSELPTNLNVEPFSYYIGHLGSPGSHFGSNKTASLSLQR